MQGLSRYALTLRMLRRLPLLALAIAVFLAAEPLVHSHPLFENGDARSAAGNAACAVCAAGVNQLPTVAPAVSAPAFVIATLPAQLFALQAATLSLSLPSRAPPAL
jgi:hypothetical protein